MTHLRYEQNFFSWTEEFWKIENSVFLLSTIIFFNYRAGKLLHYICIIHENNLPILYEKFIYSPVCLHWLSTYAASFFSFITSCLFRSQSRNFTFVEYGILYTRAGTRFEFLRSAVAHGYAIFREYHSERNSNQRLAEPIEPIQLDIMHTGSSISCAFCFPSVCISCKFMLTVNWLPSTCVCSAVVSTSIIEFLTNISPNIETFGEAL